MEDPAKDIILNNCQICGVAFYIDDRFKKFCVKCIIDYSKACQNTNKGNDDTIVFQQIISLKNQFINK